jgi:disulfide bond formation protein DsbB
MTATRWFAGIAIGCLAAVAAALVSQYKFDMQPCPWCVLQRVIFLAVALACVVGLVWRRTAGRMLASAVGIALAACGIGSALWQHFKAAASASCSFTLADKIIGTLQLDSLAPDVFSPRASCADAAVKLLGVPYDFWSLALFTLIAIAMVGVLRQLSRHD